MNALNWYLDVIKKYAVFEGRARRSEYWFFMLIHFAAFIVLGIIDGVIGMSIFSTVYMLATLVPSIGVAIRRAHDTGRVGWWILVPVAGLIFMCLEGDSKANAYGPNPKDDTAAPAAA